MRRAGSGGADGDGWPQFAAMVFLSAFSVVTLAMPLGATKLYLFGISVDQQFRTEYLTRLTDTAGPHDMTYCGLPPFYPPGWFWIGGRHRRADRDTRLGDVQAVGDHLHHRRGCGRIGVVGEHDSLRIRVIVSTATTAVTLAYAPAEPYAAIITVLLPAIFVLAWSGLRGATRAGGWAAVVGVGIFLGVAALFYTLLLAYSAFTLTIMAVLLAVVRRRLDPLLRLVVIAVIAGAIALIGWGTVSIRRDRRITGRFRYRTTLSAG